MKNKDKLILVFYINAVDQTQQKVAEMMRMTSEATASLREDGTVLTFILPGTEHKIECINPQLVTEEGYEHVKSVLETAQKLIMNNADNGQERSRLK